MKSLKKIIALFLTCMLSLSMLAACGGSSTSSEDSSDSASEGNSIKAGLICLHDENSTYDANFINAFKEACEEMGLVEGETYFITTGIPEGQECYEEACNMVDRGCNFVFADSFGHEDYMIEAAKEYPEVQFCHATGTKAHTENLANYHNAFAEIFEGRYLAGVAAGMKLNEMIANNEITAEEAKMGYVGAFTYAEVISGYTSFYLGAKSVCDSVTMSVTFTGSWYDETKEKEGAQSLINSGCVLISQHADSMGAPTACETAGVPNVSYNGSTIDACPNTFIVSSRINWAPYFTYAMESIKNGTEILADWTGTLDTGSVLLTDVNEDVAAEGTAAKIEEVKAALEKGEINVFDITTFTVGGEELSSYMADVDTDENYTPDTEVIEDGAFQESKFRSAPYFDVQIDGITLLDTAF